MIARRCPECNTKWYSANTRAWKCDKCGAEITDETRMNLKEEVNEKEQVCSRNDGLS